MNKSEIKQFKSLFENILNEKSLKKIWEGEENNSNSGDEVDLAGFHREKELSSKLLNRNSHYLKKVKYALEKINNETFGSCEDCGADISHQRLKARPTATLCIACKEESEKIENTTFDRSNVINLPTKNTNTEKTVSNDPFKKNVTKLDNGEIRVLV